MLASLCRLLCIVLNIHVIFNDRRCLCSNEEENIQQMQHQMHLFFSPSMALTLCSEAEKKHKMHEQHSEVCACGFTISFEIHSLTHALLHCIHIVGIYEIRVYSMCCPQFPGVSDFPSSESDAPTTTFKQYNSVSISS